MEFIDNAPKQTELYVKSLSTEQIDESVCFKSIKNEIVEMIRAVQVHAQSKNKT